MPCLAHTDANFHNIIVGADQVTLVDWDYPAVRYPLEELEALEEHAYLNGVVELPGRLLRRLRQGRLAPAPADPPHRELLGDAELDGVVRHGSRQSIPPGQRSMIRRWDEQLRDWIYRIDVHLDQT